MHRSLLLSSILFIIISDLAISQSRVRVLDIIEQSLPKCEKVWRLVEQPWLNEENSVPQATFDWTNGKEDVSAYVFVFQETTGAENNLRIGNKDDEPYLRLDGIGDEAYFWSPATNSRYSRYTVQFRKAGVLVFLSSPVEDVAKRSAKCIANAIGTQRDNPSAD